VHCGPSQLDNCRNEETEPNRALSFDNADQICEEIFPGRYSLFFNLMPRRNKLGVCKGGHAMHYDEIEQWEQTQAEIAIRRWLYSIGQWAPQADRAARFAQIVPRGQLITEQIDKLLRSKLVGPIGCCAAGQTYVVPVFMLTMAHTSTTISTKE
jgi:hypothetical protein